MLLAATAQSSAKRIGSSISLMVQRKRPRSLIMARQIPQTNFDVLVLTRQEATDLIALLVGQLAQKPVQGNQQGACPELIVTRSESRPFPEPSVETRTRLMICLGKNEP